MKKNLLESGKIDNYQLILLVAGFCIGDVAILPLGKTAGHDAWLAILLGMGIGLLFAGIYLWLNGRFPGKTLVEIYQLIYGKYCGAFFSLCFIWFMFHTSTLVVSLYSQFVAATMLPKTPSLLIIALTVLISLYAIRNGLEPVARSGEILVPMILAIMFISIALLVKNLDSQNFLPIFEKPWSQIFQAAVLVSTFPFGESVVFLMILPFSESPKRTGRSLIMGICIAGIALTVAAVLNIGALGVSAEILNFPAYHAYRLINIYGFISRLEILALIALFTMDFLKATLLLYGTVLGINQLFKLRDFKPILVPLGILAVVFARLNFSNIAETFDFAQRVWPIYAIPFEIGIPLLTLLVALFRKLPREAKG